MYWLPVILCFFTIGVLAYVLREERKHNTRSIPKTTIIVAYNKRVQRIACPVCRQIAPFSTRIFMQDEWRLCHCSGCEHIFEVMN